MGNENELRGDVLAEGFAPNYEVVHDGPVAVGEDVTVKVNTLYTDSLLVVWELTAPDPLEAGQTANTQFGAREVRPYDAQRPTPSVLNVILTEETNSGVGTHIEEGTNRFYIMNRYNVRGLHYVDMRLVNGSGNNRTARIHVFRHRPSLTTPSGA